MQTKIQGWGALAIAIAFVGVRLLTLGSTDDPQLRDAIKAELANDLGNQVGKALDEHTGEYTAEDVQRLVDLADRESIVIYATHVSRPLLAWGSSEKVIVKLRYSLPEQPVREEYWRFSHGALSGWRYRGRSSVVSYYLNFM